ncbi:alpha/beta fold hydrolase [Archangium lansingense]|uniref:Alpha/beta fold hydrolase n=1 Tax=Archangium lansingense TaxID=2995310 RepID=A0ABT3ZXV9_9BACT|nr:alpha/beta fold hydrolase [Archangium lansinium]MCY1073584.1 alpha/beta fold hydrolase [Archangium lansinium]
MNGARLHYELQGDGFPVVLLHGGLLDMRLWNEQVGPLARHFTTLRYDLRGFGSSDVPEGQPYAPYEDLRALLDYFSMDRVHVVGLSLGGRVALDFALAWPERVSCLVLVAPGIQGAPPAPEENVWLTDLLDSERGTDARAVAEAWLESDYLASAMARPSLAPVVRQWTLDNRGSLASAHLARFLSPPAYTQLEHLLAPTLVMVGDRDNPVMLRNAEVLARRVPALTRVTLPGVGHLPNLERPDDFNRVLLDFLIAQVSTRPPTAHVP